MLFRRATITTLGLAVLLVGCSDRIDRPASPTGPDALASYTKPNLIHLIQDLVSPGPWRGGSISRFNDIRPADNRQAAGNELLRYMLEAYGAGAIPEERISDLVAFFRALAEFYGLDFDLPPQEIDPDLESMLRIVTAGMFSGEEEICFPTDQGPQVGNAAMCLTINSLNLPTFIAIIQKLENGYTFPFPEGFEGRGNIFDFNVFGNLNTGSGAAGVLIVLCSPLDGLHNEPHVFLRDNGDGTVGGPFTPIASPYSCPEPQTTFLRGQNIFARSVNAAGSFLMSALSPRRAFADHSLAHRQFNRLSPWTLALEGEDAPELAVRIVWTPNENHTDTHAYFQRTGAFNFGMEISLDDVVQGCADEIIVQARATFASPTQVGSWTTASECGDQGFRVALQNLRSPNHSSGIIDVRVQIGDRGFVVLAPPLTFSTVDPGPQ